MTHFPGSFPICSRKLCVMYLWVSFTKRKKEHVLKSVWSEASFFKASFQAPKEISRKEEWGRCLCRGQAGRLQGGRLVIAALCRRKIVMCVLCLLFPLPVWISGLKGEICSVWQCLPVVCQLRFNGTELSRRLRKDYSELFYFGESMESHLTFRRNLQFGWCV